MVRLLTTLLGLAAVLACITGPIVFALYEQRQLRHFRVVHDGVLYRSGQLSPEGLQRVLHDHLIRTVITLRDARMPGQPPPDRAEEEYCRGQGIAYVRIPPRSWDAHESDAPADEGVRTFLEVMSDARNYPVLVHCFNGIHRTGAYCAIYRLEFDHWSNGQAIDEMMACGYTNLADEMDILGYLEEYVPRWRRARLDCRPGVAPGSAGVPPADPGRRAGRPRFQGD
jgi:protein tyrosine/serine phosphatase